MDGAISTYNATSPWRLDCSPWNVTIVLSLLLAILCLFHPAVDLEFSRKFYSSDGRFFGEANYAAVFLRHGFITAYAVVCVTVAAGLFLTRDRLKTVFNLRFSQWLFLSLCLATGPGVVANLALKDHWGRARPREIVEFGGLQKFSAAAVPAKECVRNCSFVCGESSSMFAMFFAGACVWRRRFKALITAGIFAGGAAGLVRMSQGAHFFSDVLFSGIFMASTVFFIDWVFEAIASSGPQKSVSAPHQRDESNISQRGVLLQPVSNAP